MTVKGLENIGIIQETGIQKRINAHSTCQVSLFLENDETLSKLKGKVGMEVCIEDEDRIYMRGTVREISFDRVFSGSRVAIHIVSFSDKVDRNRNRRVFQNTRKKYGDIISELNSGACCFQITDHALAELQEPLLILQEDRTDFEFVRSIAQNCGRYLFVNDTDRKCILSIGVDCGAESRKLSEENVIKYSAVLTETNEKIRIKTHEYLEFGKTMAYEGQVYVIIAVTICHKNGSTEFEYTLEKKNGKVMSDRDYISTWLGRAKVTDTADPEHMGRIQVSFLEYEDSTEKDKMWIPYLPCLTEKEQGIVLIPGSGEIVHVFCKRGVCYSDGCVRETALAEKIRDIAGRSILLKDKYISFQEEKAELEAFAGRIRIEEGEFMLSNADGGIKIEKDRMLIKNGNSKLNMNDSLIQLLADRNIDIKSDRINFDGESKISAKTSSFDVG